MKGSFELIKPKILIFHFNYNSGNDLDQIVLRQKSRTSLQKSHPRCAAEITAHQQTVSS